MSKDYKAFFSLQGPAFSKFLDTAALYTYPDLQACHYYLGAALNEGALALLTGPVGAGKTTALRSFLATQPLDRMTVLYVGYTASDRALFREMAQGLGITPAFLKADLIVQLHTTIEHLWMSQQRRTLLVVDDAHLLSPALLVELQQLLNFQMDTVTPLNLMLVGQPALRETLKSPRHEALDQRILIRYTLAGLSRSELDAYVAAHLQAVGGHPEIFTPEALDRAFQHAKGIPREINNVCLYALIRAAWYEKPLIERGIVQEVIQAQMAP